MRSTFFYYLFTCSWFLLFNSSCSTEQERSAAVPATVKENKTLNPVDTISLTRADVKKAPVASFSKKTDNPLNDWYFKVNIHETPATFKYLLRMQFEEIRGEDTLKIPNLGMEPKPVIKPGKEQYSCIVGFLDKQGNFREYKKVYVKNNSLKVTTIRHYSVRSY